MRSLRSSLVGLAVALTPATSAYAAVNDVVDVSRVGDSAQRLTVTMSDTSNERRVALAATYRAVPADAELDVTAVCPQSLSSNSDPRLIDETTPPEPYSVQRSRQVPLQLHLTCLYRDGRLDSKVLSGRTTVPGGGSPGGALRPVSIRLRVSVDGQRATFRGDVRGRSRGDVRLQRRVSGKWRTQTRAKVRRGRFQHTVRIRRGQRWRVAMPATKTTTAGRSGVIRFR